MRQILMMIIVASGVLMASPRLMANSEATSNLVDQLNEDGTVRGEPLAKAYRVLFDAYLEITPPPQPVGRSFNQGNIWPGMSGWDEVARWASANKAMVDAIIKASERTFIALPYGVDQVPPSYVESGLCVNIVINDGQPIVDFRYFEALDTISALATAEIYRRFETGDIDGALDLLNAKLFVLRMFCDRQFMQEKTHTFELLTESLSNARDMYWTYMDRISAEQFREISLRQLPYLRPDRARLLIPEADRLVAEAVLEEVFDTETGDPIPDRFVDVFSRMQSNGEPLTRMGAAARWRSIAGRHASHLASKERLELIYDDWWRRWRIRNRQLAELESTQFDDANPMRYAAVLISVENIQQLFDIRNRLRVAVYGTAISAGLCGFHRRFGEYPNDQSTSAQRLYGSEITRQIDKDPYNYLEKVDVLGPFHYRKLDKKTLLVVRGDRLWLEAGEGLLYSMGPDEQDDRGEEHAELGDDADIIIWPPIKALLRKNGFMN